MKTKEINKDLIYGSSKQKFAKFLHHMKAKFKSKEFDKIQWLKEFIPVNAVILDIGANMGYFTKEFAKIYDKSCTVYAFEPVEYNYTILYDICKNIDNVILENIALDEENGSKEIYIPVKEQGKIGPALAHFGQENDRNYVKENIITMKLDDYVKSKNIESVDFIKCDVEGAELLVFKGGLNTIQNDKPTVFCEVNDEFMQRVGSSAPELLNLFLDLGYFAYEIDFNDFSLIKQVTTYTHPCDFIFTTKAIDLS